ncbi:MAG: HPP family protein [Proteobacteria bacterium]|nr:HPP family protein [Pseudomonadota bacterium]
MKADYTFTQRVARKWAGLVLGWNALKIGYTVSEREHWISGVGGLFGILLVWWVSSLLVGDHVAVLVASSMGSSAVLLFAAPHGGMSQPWSVFGGHIVSALAGVASQQWLGHDPMLAASMAVGLAIALMYPLRCLHPPGGATAITAVVGGGSVHALGYGFVVMPIMINTVIILLAAAAYNFPFSWRRYPQAWWRMAVVSEPTADAAGADEKCMIPHSDLVYALSQIDTFIDVSEEDLQKIYALALGHHQHAAEASGLTPEPVAEAAR